MELPKHSLLLLDGAMGTMLQKGGMRPGENSVLLNLTRPELIQSIHRAYIDAGSQVIYANTFGANRKKLARTGHSVAEVVAAAIRNAKAAAQGTEVKIALDVGPIGELLAPMGTLSFHEAYDIFAEMMEAGQWAGADLIVIETMTDLYETKAALLAAVEAGELPTFVTMTFDESGRTFTGCTVSSMARTLTGLGADAIGVNCSLGPGELVDVVRELRANTPLPIIAKPNAGLPDPVDGHYDLTAGAFAAAMLPLIDAGASIIGGCCGTDPGFIAALKKASAGKRPGGEAGVPSAFLCTPTHPLPLTGVRVIGERINPTGKKRLQQALKDNDLRYIVDLAVQQADAGAQILDVNVGFPGVDEVAMLPRAVEAIQAAVDVPLQLDSANPRALEAALRVYNGKPAVNSVSGEEKSLSQVLPLVKQYGAAVVGLTLDEGGIPDTAEGRLQIARRILDRALSLGIPREDVWIDCLTLTVSAQQDQAEETLRAVALVRRELGLQTVLGVSNISFGLPARLLITQTFLARALHSGLTLPIVNPNQREIMDTVAAFRALSGEDRKCEAYVSRFAGREDAPAVAPNPGGSMTLRDAIARGLGEEAAALAKGALETVDEMTLVERDLIPALDEVGVGYEKGVVFLPQLLSAAQAAQAVFEVLRASLSRRGGAPVSKGTLIVATVQGDIHDIGKNIVKTVLENYGYTVVDLGKDVAPETVAGEARRLGARLVGLSALMTTTLPAMEETIRLLHQLPSPPHVFVGGAVVTPEYAQKMGADAYAKDARASVAIAREILG